MPPPKQRSLLERAPNFSKTEAGVKALVFVFVFFSFLFSSSLPVFALGALAPMLILPRAVLLADCPCFPARRKAYRLHPPSTSPGLEFDFAQVDGGTPAARYSVSAAGAGGQRDRRARRALAAGLEGGALRAWLPTRHPGFRRPVAPFRPAGLRQQNLGNPSGNLKRFGLLW